MRDSNLKLTLAFGIGMHHAGLHERDRKTVEELFINCKIQVPECGGHNPGEQVKLCQEAPMGPLFHRS